MFEKSPKKVTFENDKLAYRCYSGFSLSVQYKREMDLERVTRQGFSPYEGLSTDKHKIKKKKNTAHCMSVCVRFSIWPEAGAH